MIQDIHPHQLQMTFQPRQPNDDDFIAAFRPEGKTDAILFAETDGAKALPRYAQFKNLADSGPDRFLYLFSVDGAGVFLYGGTVEEIAPGYTTLDVQKLREFEPGWQAFTVLTAHHLMKWYQANRYCGTCGQLMAAKPDERALRCGGCGGVVYPRISPAVIVGVIDREADAILLTRYANRPNAKLTALIAGFMEVGEAFEDTIRREVFEEVGLRAKNIRYYKSQPWAYSGSVLAGFYAEVEGSREIHLDQTELQEAAWMQRGDLPVNPGAFSLTAEMVETFRTGGV